MGKTVAEKIFDTHRIDNPAGDMYVLSLDAVFCHEITTPVAINDLVRRYHSRFVMGVEGMPKAMSSGPAATHPRAR